MHEAMVNLVTGLPLDMMDSKGWVGMQRTLVEDVLGPLRGLLPRGGSHLSEANRLEPDWEGEFYCGNYERLTKVKDKYDSDGVSMCLRGWGVIGGWRERMEGCVLL